MSDPVRTGGSGKGAWTNAKQMTSFEETSPRSARGARTVRPRRRPTARNAEKRAFAGGISALLACGALTASVWGVGTEGSAAAAGSSAPRPSSAFAVAAPGTHPTSPTTADPKAGLSLAFNPSFQGKKLNTSTWSTCYPAHECNNYGNDNEVEWYRPSGVTVSHGTLHLVATQTPTKGTDSSGAPKTYPYKSGMVTTKSSFSFTYGYVQVVAKIPATDGTWPALWLLPKAVKWPPEIDIMENFGNTNAIATTYHWGTTGQPHQAASVFQASKSLAVGFHTYGLLWKHGSLTWYFDGKVVYKYTGKAVPTQSMYFLANLAIDGPASSGSSFDIRSVKIYK